MRKLACLFLLLIFPVSVCFAAPKIEVKEAWVREVPPSSSLTAAYMLIENRGDEDESLVGVTSPVSNYAEIHTVSVNEEGMARMQKVEAIDIPAGRKVELKPGGYHVMLIELKKPLKAGDTVELNLQFKKSGILKVTAPVKGTTEMTEHKTHQMHH